MWNSILVMLGIMIDMLCKKSSRCLSYGGPSASLPGSVNVAPWLATTLHFVQDMAKEQAVGCQGLEEFQGASAQRSGSPQQRCAAQPEEDYGEVLLRVPPGPGLQQCLKGTQHAQKVTSWKGRKQASQWTPLIHSDSAGH